MDAQNLSKLEFHQWKESFVRLESRFETVFAELRLIRATLVAHHTTTSPPASISEPLPATIVVKPPPITASAPPLVTATTPPAAPLPFAASQWKQAPFAQTPAPIPAPKTTPPLVQKSLNQAAKTTMAKKNIKVKSGAVKNRQWRPPWFSLRSYPDFSLRTRSVRVGWIGPSHWKKGIKEAIQIFVKVKGNGIPLILLWFNCFKWWLSAKDFCP